MKTSRFTSVLALGMATHLFASAAMAAPVYVRSNQVVEVVSDDDLSITRNREGDRFSVTVANDRDFPRGTRLEGVVRDIREKRNDRPAYMDLDFTSALLPDGRRVGITAVPISLDSKAISKGRDGRMTADPKKVKTENYVIGGLVGGLVVGALLKKPFEGAFIGALAGIVLGESERQKGNSNGDLVLRRGTKLGALFERDVNIDYNDRYDDRYDNGRYDDGRYDDRNDDRYDNGRNDDRYDRNDDRYNRDDVWNITHNNRRLSFDSRTMPFKNGSTVMVPLQRTAEQMGFDVDLRTGSNVIYVEDDETSLRLEQGTRNYRLNGKRGTLSRALETRNGVVYAPLEILATASEKAVFVNGTRLDS